MQLTRQAPPGRQLIQSYRVGEFRVADIVFKGPVLVTATQTRSWPVAAFSELTPEAFAPLFGDPVDVCLLGCGQRVALLPRPLRDRLKQAGLVVDVMDTGAACRTYNMLIAEGRLVAAAVFPI